MRANRGRVAEVDEVEDGGRAGRRGRGTNVDIEAARLAWEPIVCPECGTDHPDTISVRLKRVGREVVARCSDCGAIAARYTGEVWNS